MANKKFVRIVAVSLAVILLLGIVGMGISAMAVTQAEIDALEAQRDAIRDQQADIQEQIDAIESEMSSVIEKKETLDKQNELNRQDIELINEQIELYDQMIAQKAEELEEAIRLEKEQYERYCKRVRTMEENGNWSYVSFIFKANSLADLLSRLNDVADIVEHDKNLEDEYIAAREHVETVKAEYEAVQVEQEAKKEELLEEKEKLEKQIEEAYTLIKQLEDDIEAYKLAYEENAGLESEVQAKIDQKVKELQAQKAAEEAARKAAEAAKNQYTSSGSSYGGSGYTWPCPSSGYVTSKFGYRVHPIFGTTKYHSGIDIAANSGASILAARGGTVSIAEYSSSYGNYVVIYHANGTTTLYAHMSSMAVSVGQTVSQGQTIGYVGSTGWSTGPHLHYEVRVNGSCVDPLGYHGGMSLSYSPTA